MGEVAKEGEVGFHTPTKNAELAIFILQDLEWLYRLGVETPRGYTLIKPLTTNFWQSTQSSRAWTRELVRQPGEPFSQRELRIRTEKGKKHWADLTAKPVDQEASALLSTAFDITEC